MSDKSLSLVDELTLVPCWLRIRSASELNQLYPEVVDDDDRSELVGPDVVLQQGLRHSQFRGLGGSRNPRTGGA